MFAHLPEVQALIERKRECHRRYRSWTSDEPMLVVLMIVSTYHAITATFYQSLSWSFWISMISMSGVTFVT